MTFWTLPVSYKLGIDRYKRYKKNRLDKDNQWTCEKCKHVVQPDKKIMLWNSSDVILYFLTNLSKYFS